ncbi:MAG: nitroreductase family protein [Bacillota bacterium]|nr:nitroreductase family protein [Bacillota bacterium]
MEIMEALFTRRTIRSFTGEGISRENLTDIIRAGMSAPSAHGRRPWRILTVESLEKRKALMPLCQWWQMLDKAGVAIVVCSDKSMAEDMPWEFQLNDCSAACENMLLAAHGLGLGGVWLGICESDEKIAKFKKVLEIPDNMRVIGMLAVGHPSAEPKPEERFDPKKWYSETWGRSK